MGREADRADAQLVSAIRERAAALAEHTDSVHRQAGEILHRFASFEARDLRQWMVDFRDRQAAQREAEAGEETTVEPESRSPAEVRAALVAALAQPGPNDGVVRDGEGLPAAVDVPQLLDSLAFWIASQRPPQRWQRDPALLAAVAAKSRELQELLARPGGPPWPPAIELFEQQFRPTWNSAGDLSAYRRDVRSPLMGQDVAGLLRNLAVEADRLARMRQLDSAVQHTKRPNTAGALDRLRAHSIREWFVGRCGSIPSMEVIASAINLSRSEQDRRAQEDVTGAQVREWLRRPRRTSAQSRS